MTVYRIAFQMTTSNPADRLGFPEMPEHQSRVLVRTAKNLDETSSLVFEPIGFLGDETFESYKGSLRGSIFDWEAKEWRASAQQALGIAQRMESADIALVPTPEARSLIEQEVTVARQRWDEGIRALEDTQSRLALQGKSLFPFQVEDIKWSLTRKSLINSSEVGLGKAQPLDARVLTPKGFVPIGTLKKGDWVIGQSGESCRVTGVFPQGRRRIFKVSFSDQSSTRCCEDHLWTYQPTQHRGTDKFIVESLGQIMADIKQKKHTKWKERWIPIMRRPAVMNERKVVIDPYILGVLLGDGCFTKHVTLSTSDQEIADAVQSRLPPEMTLKRYKCKGKGDNYQCVFGNKVNTRKGHVIAKELKNLGLFGLKGHDKFIPELYQNNAAEVRIAILQGLMDTDGSISKSGLHTKFTTTSKRLADGITYIVRSLGGLGFIDRQCPGGRRKPIFNVALKLPSEIVPFLLQRKIKRRVPLTQRAHPCRKITSIEDAGEADTVCISVSASNGLYITDDFIVTHNTAVTLCSLQPNQRVLVCGPSVSKGVWVRETKNWRPDYKPSLLSGLGSFRYPEPGELLATNFDILEDSPPKAPEGLILIGDEAHLLKNKRTQRTKRFAALADQAARVILLTGTPLPNRPDELWSVLMLAKLAHEAFGSKANFAKCFSGKAKYLRPKNIPDGEPIPEDYPKEKLKFVGFDWGDPLPEAGERLKSVMVRHLKKDVLKDLPDKIFRTVDVEITQDIRQKLDTELQALGGPAILDVQDIKDIPFEKFAKVRSMLAKAKLDAALEMVESYEEQDEPVVVFSMHRYPIDIIGKRPGWVAITGDTPNTASNPMRNRIEEEFQAGKYKGIAAMIQAASTALTLTRASVELFIDEDFVPASNLQAQGRCHRIGSKNSVLINRLVADHVLDRRVSELLEKKMKISDMSVELARERKKVGPTEFEATLPKLLKPPMPAGFRGPKSSEERLAGEWVVLAAGFTDSGPPPNGKQLLLKHYRLGKDWAASILCEAGLSERSWKGLTTLHKSYIAMKRIP